MRRKACRQQTQRNWGVGGAINYGEQDSENNVQSSMSSTSSSGMFHFSGSSRQSSVDKKCRTWKMTCRVTGIWLSLNISHVNQFRSGSNLMHGTSAIEGRHIAGPHCRSHNAAGRDGDHPLQLILVIVISEVRVGKFSRLPSLQEWLCLDSKRKSYMWIAV